MNILYRWMGGLHRLLFIQKKIKLSKGGINPQSTFSAPVNSITTLFWVTGYDFIFILTVLNDILIGILTQVVCLSFVL